jgi:hypothetical protein
LRKKFILNIQHRTLNIERKTENQRRAALDHFINSRAAREFRRHQEIAAPVMGQTQPLTADKYVCEQLQQPAVTFCAATACSALPLNMSVAGASSCLGVFVANLAASVLSLERRTTNDLH